MSCKKLEKGCWRATFPLSEEEVLLQLKELLVDFESVFSDELCFWKNFKVNSLVEKSAISQFCRVHGIFYLLKNGIEKNLIGYWNNVSLKQSHILTGLHTFYHSISKVNNGTVWVCEDDKHVCTLWHISNTHTENLFASLKEREKFSKLIWVMCISHLN